MAGTLTVGGNIIATHTGVEGAGTVSANNVSLGSNVQFPAGHVIQVVSQNFTGTASRSNTDYLDTFLTKSITSHATNSRFLVMVNSITGGNDASPRIQLRRTIGSNTTDIDNSGVTMSSDARLSGVRHGTNLHLSYVDEPSVASETSINYLIRLRSTDTFIVYLGQTGFTEHGDINVLSSMTIMEIAA